MFCLLLNRPQLFLLQVFGTETASFGASGELQHLLGHLDCSVLDVGDRRDPLLPGLVFGQVLVVIAEFFQSLHSVLQLVSQLVYIVHDHDHTPGHVWVCIRVVQFAVHVAEGVLQRLHLTSVTLLLEFERF